jgi:hypothetical protein
MIGLRVGGQITEEIGGIDLGRFRFREQTPRIDVHEGRFFEVEYGRTP